MLDECIHEYNHEYECEYEYPDVQQSEWVPQAATLRRIYDSRHPKKKSID